MLRTPPPPPPPPPQSVALLTALGYLQELVDGGPVYEEDELAAVSGIQVLELLPLIDRAEEKGYLEIGEDGAISLTAKGWRWYEMHGGDV